VSALPKSAECLRDATPCAEAAQVREAVAFGLEGMPAGTSKDRRTRNHVHASLPKGATSAWGGAAWRNGNPHAFEAAMENELALLKTSLYGYKLDSETSERTLRLRNAYGMEFGVLSRDKVQLDKNLFDDAQSVWLAQNGTYEELGKMRDYDIIPHVISQSELFESRAAEYMKTLAPATAMGVMKKDVLVLDMLKGLCLIVVCNEVVVKFAVECKAKDLGNAEVWISGFKVEGMTEEDYKHVKKA
jgi:hypothetical protein